MVSPPAPILEYLPEMWSMIVVAGTLNLHAAADRFIPCSLTAVTATRRAYVEYLVLVFLLYDRTMVILLSNFVFAPSYTNNAAIHLAPPFTVVAGDQIIELACVRPSY